MANLDVPRFEKEEIHQFVDSVVKTIIFEKSNETHRAEPKDGEQQIESSLNE